MDSEGDVDHAELGIFRERYAGVEESFISGEAMQEKATGQRRASAPEHSLLQDLQQAWNTRAEPDGVFRWLAIGGEDILRTHPDEKVKALADKLRQHFDMSSNIKAKLYKGLMDIQEGYSKEDFNAAKEEFAEYMLERESYPKKADGKTHSEASKEAARIFYAGMSPAGKALVDWAKGVAKTTGLISVGLDIMVKDGDTWRPIGNLGELHFPRMLTRETYDMIGNWMEPGGEYRPEYRQLLMDMRENGNVPKTDDIAGDLRKAHNILHTGYTAMTKADYLANVELARGMKLPDKNSVTGKPYYDTTLRGYTNFIERFADRAAQISAFGQKTDKTPRNAWDELLDGQTFGKYDPDYRPIIKKIQMGVEREGVKWGWPDAAVGLTGGLLLGSPLGSARNLATAYWFTGETFGFGRTTFGGLDESGKFQAGALPLVLHSYLKAANQTFRNVMNKDWRLASPELVQDAMNAGALQQHIVNGMILDIQDDTDEAWNDPKSKANKLRWFTNKALFFHSVSERMGRTINYVAAQQWLETSKRLIEGNIEGNLSSIPGYDKLPGTYTAGSAWGKRVMTLQRLGFTGDELNKLLAGDQATVEKFLRAAVREKQYSYDVSQTPVLFYGPHRTWGKLFLQFQKWGFQRTRDIWRNVLQPTFGREVVNPATGKKVKVRDWTPLIRFLLMGVAAGELYALLREWLKDKERTESKLPMIWSAYEENPSHGQMLALERIGMDFVMSGHGGIVSDYGMLTRDIATRGPRYRSPLSPPSFAIATDLASLIASRVQRGHAYEGLHHDIIDLLNKFPTTQQAGVGLNRFHIFGHDAAARQSARREVRNLRILARDYAEEFDLEFRAYNGLGTKNPNMEYREMKEALSIGDLDEANRIKNNLLDGLDGMEKKKMLQSIKGSVRQSQPLMGYGITSKEKQGEFMLWLRKRNPEAAAGLLEVQNRYHRTARAGNLMK